MSHLQNRIAVAMEKRRAELIHLPLARIWPELALAAIQEMRTPNETTRAAIAELEERRDPADAPSAFRVMADQFGLATPSRK